MIAAPDHSRPQAGGDMATVEVVQGYQARHSMPGVVDFYDTKYSLVPGLYTFRYQKGEFSPIYGAIRLQSVANPRANDFIRFTTLTLTPDPSGTPSILSEADLARARNGDLVTKAVFMADLAGVRSRLDQIDRELFKMDRLRITLGEQLDYWNRKLAERRMNTRYSSEFGWGVDTPSWDLGLLQTLVGAERYHWHRFSKAEDQVRTYERKLADLDIPNRSMVEEREALRQLLGSVDVIYRSGEIMVLAPSMIRPYHDAVAEVESRRGNVTSAEFHMPYLYASLPNKMLPPALRLIITPEHSPSGSIGELLMVVAIGARGPGGISPECQLANAE